MGHFWRRGLAAFVVASIILVVVGLVVDGDTGGSKPKADDTPPSNPTGEPPVVDKAYLDRYGSYDCSAVVPTVNLEYGDGRVDKTPIFRIGAEWPVGDGGRLWSDAVNLPLPEEQRNRAGIQATICQDPLQAAMVMNGLGGLEFDGRKIGELNPWMMAQGDSSEIAKWAEDCMVDDINVHLDCAAAMRLTATLLGRFYEEGVEKTPTEWNYHLTGGGLVVGAAPEVARNPEQYSGQFVIFQVTTKTEDCVLRVGFNVGKDTVNGGDQRLAKVPCKVPTPPKTKTPATTPKPTPTTKPTPTPTTTPKPTPTTKPTPTPTTTPTRGKTHTDSPVSSDRNDPCEACRPNELDEDGNIRPSSDGGRPKPKPTGPVTTNSEAPPPPPTTTVPADDPEINLPDVEGDVGLGDF